jgi:hypothetical protein
MTLDGPVQAAPGESVQYRLHYEVTPSQGTGIVLTWSDGSLQYLSSHFASGTGQLMEEEKSGDFAHVRWNLAGGSGELDLDLQIPEGHGAGEFTVYAYEPGTGAAQSNVVRTAIIP